MLYRSQPSKVNGYTRCNQTKQTLACTVILIFRELFLEVRRTACSDLAVQWGPSKSGPLCAADHCFKSLHPSSHGSTRLDNVTCDKTLSQSRLTRFVPYVLSVHHAQHRSPRRSSSCLPRCPSSQIHRISCALYDSYSQLRSSRSPTLWSWWKNWRNPHR